MTREALKKLNEKQMNYCKTLSALIDRAKIKGLKEENERNRGKLRGFLECIQGERRRRAGQKHRLCAAADTAGIRGRLSTHYAAFIYDAVHGR